MKEIFKKVTPESVGVSSSLVKEFLETLDERRLHTHAILMTRGDEMFAESYYAPFHKNFLHRMYSVSKSFVAIAVGVAVTEGLISLDDIIVDYFPECKNENTDELYESCTVRDMLMMKSNVGTLVKWWGNFDSRVEAYYSQKSNKLPGALFKYDSIGSFMLGCIIEKLTGMNFLEYLKEKVLLKIGFSKESYVLREPGGYAVGDSGVMCTAEDLLIFARLIMKGGNWNGVQYIDPEFMAEAIKKQGHNDFNGTHGVYGAQGYGYLIWKTHPDGFTLTGMGDQLAVCDMKRDICFVITSDNQAEKGERHVLLHEYYKHFLPKITEQRLPEDEAAYRALEGYTGSRKLVSQYGEATSPTAKGVFGKTFVKRCGELPIDELTLTEDALLMKHKGRSLRLEFGMLENKATHFSFGTRARADMMGIYEEGEYDVNSSAGWVEDKTFAILAQVTDTYFGLLAVHIAFDGDKANMVMKRSGQYVFEDIDGFAVYDLKK